MLIKPGYKCARPTAAALLPCLTRELALSPWTWDHISGSSVASMCHMPPCILSPRAVSCKTPSPDPDKMQIQAFQTLLGPCVSRAFLAADRCLPWCAGPLPRSGVGGSFVPCRPQNCSFLSSTEPLFIEFLLYTRHSSSLKYFLTNFKR